MNINAELKPTSEKDYYTMYINGVDLGTWERSQVRQLIGQFDNQLT